METLEKSRKELALEELTETAGMYGIDVQKIDGGLMITCPHKYPFTWSITGLDYTDIVGDGSEEDSSLNAFITYYAMGRISFDTLKHICDSPSIITGEYVKDSYRMGIDKLEKLVDGAINCNCPTSELIVNKIASFDYKKTSAHLYKGVYITPCMLENILKGYLNELNNQQVAKILELIKVKQNKLIKEITSLAWNDIKNDRDINILNEIDEVMK